MVKFLGKKVLATLIVLSLVMTLTPCAFAANSTTTVTKYSDLGLTGVTPHYQLNVDDDRNMTEDYTPTRDEDGKVTEKALPAVSYNATSFQQANTNVRGFNRGTDQVRKAEAYASFDGDTDNMVAKIYGGPVKDATTGAVTTTYDMVSRSVAMGGNNAQATGGNHPLRLSKAGKKQVWEIKLKFSDVTSGSYRLFQASHNNSSYTGGANSGNDVYVSTIGIENGDVFVLPAGSYVYNKNNINAKTNMTDVIVDGQLESNKWYTFVKVVEYDETRSAYNSSGQPYGSETAHWEGKVYVFDEQGNCIGGHDDMRDFGRQGDFYSLAFSTLGMAEGTNVMVDDFKVYKISDPSVTCAEDDDNDNAITLTDTSAPLIFTSNNFNFLSGDMSKVTLTNESGEDVGAVTLLQDGNIQANVSGLSAGLYTLTFDNVTNPVGKNITKTYTITIEDPAFSIDSVSFVGADGATPVDAINEGTVVNAKVTMTNGGGAPQDYVIILALYKGNQLEQLTFREGEAAIGTHSYVIEEALTAESNGMTAYIYVWDSWDSLKPFIEATPFE